MRIGIREQLGLLVLLTTLVAVAVIAIATVNSPLLGPDVAKEIMLMFALQWVNNHNFVLDIR